MSSSSGPYGPCPRCGETEVVHKMRDDICAVCRIVRAHTSEQVVLTMNLPEPSDSARDEAP